MWNLQEMFEIERRGMLKAKNVKPLTAVERASSHTAEHREWVRVAFLFSIVVLGILSSWFWEVGWKYINNPTEPLFTGPGLIILVRVLLSFIIAGVTFSSMFTKINQSSSESWLPYFVAFQNGFFWDAIFQGISGSFTS
jgi:hypothetical protein